MSICVPTRGRLPYLRLSLTTILAQSYPNLEVIVSDNHSQDGTADWCLGLTERDARVRYIRPAAPTGLYENHNEAFAASHGTYVCFFHDDDLYTPNIVARYVAWLEDHPTAGAVCSDHRRIDALGNVLDVRRDHVPSVSGGAAYVDRTFQNGRSALMLSGTMLRRAAVPEPPFDSSGTLGFSDVLTWFQIAERWDVGHLREVLWSYRIHAGADSQRRGAISREHWITFSAYVADYERRHPDETERVRGWRSAIRRFRFWALVYEIAQHHSSDRRLRMSSDELASSYAELMRVGTTPLERSLVFALRVMSVAGLGRVLGWAARHASRARPLVGLGNR